MSADKIDQSGTGSAPVRCELIRVNPRDPRFQLARSIDLTDELLPRITRMGTDDGWSGRDRSLDELGVGFVDLFQRVVDCASGMRRKPVHIVGDCREGRAYDLKVLIKNLG